MNIESHLTKIVSNCIEPIIVNLKESIDFIDFDGDQEARYDTYDRAVDTCLDVLECLIQASNSDLKQFEEFHTFAAFSFFNGCYYPDYYAFPFEYNRFRFTKFGSLDKATPELTRLLVAGVLVIRILITEVLLKPSEVFSKQTENKDLAKNCQIIALLLYNTFVNYFS